MIPIFKSVLFFLLFFLLFYFENTKIGLVYLGILWKFILFIYLVFVFFDSKKKSFYSLFFVSFLRAFKNLLHPKFLSSILHQLTEYLRYSFFPLFFYFLRIKNIPVYRVNNFLFKISVCIIISFFPFYFDILESKGQIIDYSNEFGLNQYNQLIGVFSGGHFASISLSFSIVFLYFYYLKSGLNFTNRLLLLILIFCGIYFAFLTYVRTGYIMIVLGLFALFFLNTKQKKSSLKTIFYSVLILAIGLFILIYLLTFDETFYNRIFDIRYGEQEDLGSGRLLFWITTYDLFANGSFLSIFFGNSFEILTQKIFDLTGHRVFAHNEFLNQLALNGLFGLILLIFFIFYLFKFIIKRRNSIYFFCAISFFYCYLFLMFTQGGFWFFPELYLALILYNLDSDFNNNIET